jgi:RsiW-degrading membrane proteinase PrsW (M82 family)
MNSAFRSLNRPLENKAEGTGPNRFSQRKMIKWLLFSGAVLSALFLLILILAINTLEFSPSHLLAGIILATLPVPLYLALVLWIDRFEHEPRYLLLLCFLWGGTASIFLALIINTTVQITSGRFATVVISAPFVEEIAKATILFLIFFFKREEFNGILDGIIYAAITALGFAMVENFTYYGRAFAGSLPVGPFSVFFSRGIQNPFLHPFFTCLTGIALGWASQTQNKLIRGTIPLIGIGLAIFFHALWNFSSLSGISNLIYLFLMLPGFLAVLLIAAFALRREKQIICQCLLIEVTGGRISEAEYEQLTSLHRRCKGSFQALFSKGFSCWIDQRRYYQAASELAFQRYQVSKRGAINDARLNYCEASFIELLQKIRAARSGKF